MGGRRSYAGAWYANTYVYELGGYGIDSTGTAGFTNTFSRTKLYTN